MSPDQTTLSLSPLILTNKDIQTLSLTDGEPPHTDIHQSRPIMLISNNIIEMSPVFFVQTGAAAYQWIKQPMRKPNSQRYVESVIMRR